MMPVNNPAASDAAVPKEVLIPFMASGLCHLAVLALLLYTPALTPRRPSAPPAIHVRMVALPTAAVTVPTATGARRPAKSTAPGKPAAIQPPPNAVSISTKQRPASPAAEVKEKTSLKRKTFQSGKVVDQVIERLEKDVAENRPDEIDAAIERLQQQVKDQPAPETDSQEAVRQLTVDDAARAQDARALELVDIYRVEIAFIIQKNWAYSDSLAGEGKDLVTEIAFEVLPDGRIKDIWYDKRSGNGYLDESARRAIIKSEPLPPHPAGVIRPSITVGLRFTPQGLR